MSTVSPMTAFSKTFALYRSWRNLGRCSLISVMLTTTVVISPREEEPFRLHSMDRKYLGFVSKSRLLLTYRIPGGEGRRKRREKWWEHQGSWEHKGRGLRGLEPNPRRGSSIGLGETDLLHHFLHHFLLQLLLQFLHHLSSLPSPPSLFTLPHYLFLLLPSPLIFPITVLSGSVSLIYFCNISLRAH